MTLDEGARRLGVPLDAAQRAALEGYLDLLDRWGRTYNLTAIRGRSAMRVQHVLDSLAVVPLLEAWRHRQGVVHPVFLDVGSGAGLPGVIVAIAAPAWRVACVDAVGKKAGFVRQVAAELKLPHLRAFHARVESLSADAAWRAFAPVGADVVGSRAFASLVDFVAWTARVRAPAGDWLALKGQLPEGEIAALRSAAGSTAVGAIEVVPLDVPGLRARRCAVWIHPAGPTPVPATG